MTTDWNLVRKLKLLGFEDNEARLYLASLEIGPATMWEIHQKCGLKRTTCYQLFDKFISRGIGIRTSEPKHTIFSVVSPEKLVVSLDRRKEEFKRTLPQFDAILSKSPAKPKITLYEGWEGVRQVYAQGLEGPIGGERLLFGTPQIWLAHQEENDLYVAERIRSKIRLRMIFPDKKENYALLKNDKKELRQTRFLPAEVFCPNIETHIYPGKIDYIAHSENEPFATVIESHAIAEAEKQKFELLWNIAEERYGQIEE